MLQFKLDMLLSKNAACLGIHFIDEWMFTVREICLHEGFVEDIFLTYFFCKVPKLNWNMVS